MGTIMNQKAKFQVCKYEKGLFAFPTLANCELFQHWNNRCCKLFQIVLRLSYIYVGIRSAARMFESCIGISEKDRHFLFFEISGTDTARKMATFYWKDF